MKKHLFFLSALAAATGLMTSCSSDEDIANVNTLDTKAISFATSQSVKTRSASTLSSLDKFTVSAVNDDQTSFFSGVEYAYNKATGVFASAVPNYWPVTGNLSFYAINETGEASTDAVPSYTYSDWAGETDLVAATVISGEKTIPYPLTFQHLTSQIRVSAEAKDKTEALTYKLISVRMTTPSKGVYSFAAQTGGIGQWQIDNTSTKEYSFEDALPLSFTETGSVITTDTYWNILPVTDGVIDFAVEYQVIQNSKVIADFTGSNMKGCTVTAPSLESGKRYVYNFQLSRGTNDEITFTTTVMDWDDGSVSDFVIPKVPYAIYTYRDADGTERVVNYMTETALTWDMVEGKPTAWDTNKTLVSVWMSDSIKTLNFNTFHTCQSLKSIRLSNNITKIPGYVEWSSFGDGTGFNRRNGAFVYCSSLEAIDIPASVTTIENCAFWGCSSLKVLNVPETVTSLGQGVFRDCYSLTKATLPQNITIIPFTTFTDCRNLKEVKLSDNLIGINAHAFAGCTSLKSITLPEGVTYVSSCGFKECKAITEVSFPSTIKTFGERSFYYTSLTNLHIPASITTIGTRAFTGAPLETITVSADNEKYDSRDNCNSIIRTSDNTFLFGSRNSFIPDGIKTLAAYCFYSISPDHITVPASVEKIEGYAIGSSANATRVTVNGSITLNSYAICGGNIEVIDLPETITSKDWAISYCDKLNTINYAGTKAQWKKVALNFMKFNTAATFTVNCSDGSLYYENVASSNGEYTEI